MVTQIPGIFFRGYPENEAVIIPSTKKVIKLGVLKPFELVSIVGVRIPKSLNK